MTDTPKLWRTGQANPRELYCDHVFRGRMDTAVDAKAVCEAMNARAVVAPPAPQSEPGRWLFENVPIWKETATPKIVQFAWGEFDTAKREAWAKVEADCMAQGNDCRMREERDHYREKYLEAHKDRMGLVDELDVLKKQLAEATAAKEKAEESKQSAWDSACEEIDRLKSELAAMAKVAEERKAENETARLRLLKLCEAEGETNSLEEAVRFAELECESEYEQKCLFERDAIAAKSGFRRVTKELESERAKRTYTLRQLRELRASVNDIAKNHVPCSPLAARIEQSLTDIIDNLTDAPVPPAAVPDGGSGESLGHEPGDYLGGALFCKHCNRSCLMWDGPCPARAGKQPTPDKTTPPAPNGIPWWCNACGAHGDSGSPHYLQVGCAQCRKYDLRYTEDPSAGPVDVAELQAMSAHKPESEITRHARDDVQAAAEEARQIASAIEREPERCGGRAVIAGTRYTVAQVLTELADGETVAEIAADTSMPFTAVRLTVLAAAAEMNLVREVASEIKPSLADALEKARETQKYLVEAAQNDWIRRTRVINDDLVRMLESLSEQAAGREST